MLLIAFDVKVGQSRGMVHLCFPVSIVEPAGLSFSHGWQHAVPKPTTVERLNLIENLGRITFPLSATLGSRLLVRDILALAPGDVISLGAPLRAPVHVCIGELVKFSGRLTAIDGRSSVALEGAPQSPAAA